MNSHGTAYDRNLNLSKLDTKEQYSPRDGKETCRLELFCWRPNLGFPHTEWASVCHQDMFAAQERICEVNPPDKMDEKNMVHRKVFS